MSSQEPLDLCSGLALQSLSMILREVSIDAHCRSFREGQLSFDSNVEAVEKILAELEGRGLIQRQ